MKKIGFLFFVLLFSVFHCTTMKQSMLHSLFKTPRISVKKITIQKMNFESATLNMTMNVVNSNSFPLSLEKLQYKIYIYTNEHAFLSASQKQSLIVQSMSSNSVDFLMDFAFSQIKNIDFSKKTIPYLLEGTLYIKTVIGKIKIPFKHKGEIPIPQLPKVSVTKIKILHFTPMQLQASFLIGLSIYNSNSFPLKMKDMHYDFNLNGNPVIEQGENQDISVAPGGTEYLNIVADFDLSTLKNLVSSILQQKSIDFSINGNYQFDSKKLKKKFQFTDSGQTILEK